MEAREQTKQNRKRLMNMVKGGTQFYLIEFSVDIKGNITIWCGEALEDHVAHDMFIRRATEAYLHLYDGWKRGGEMVRMETKAAEGITRDELVKAFLQFRQQHPHDGYGVFHKIAQRWCGAEKDEVEAERSDKEAVEHELRKRNRQYIAELYGEHLPVDFDFKADYDRRMAAM